MFRQHLLKLFVILLLLEVRSSATPLIALREADNCGACHKPGRTQRPVLERRCTLDCQGCHVDPNGGHARNAWGKYYTHAASSLVHFFTPKDPLLDQSRFDIHLDTRNMIQDIAGRGKRQFPMATELSLRLRPFIKYLHLSYGSVFLGDVHDSKYRVVSKDDRRYREKFAIMVDALPLNTYLRYSRGTPLYGIKRPNHSLWIRSRIGLNQYATTDALELGLTPNVPFMRVAQHFGDPNEEEAHKQKGSSYHAGLRGVSFAWHINTSGWETRSDFNKISMQAVGAGFKFLDTIFYSERNWRKVTPLLDSEAGEAIRFVHPSSMITEHSITFAQFQGVNLGSIWEELIDANIQSSRQSFFVDFHPFPYLQLELWHRKETGTRQLTDSLALIHLYGDW